MLAVSDPHYLLYSTFELTVGVDQLFDSVHDFDLMLAPDHSVKDIAESCGLVSHILGMHPCLSNTHLDVSFHKWHNFGSCPLLRQSSNEVAHLWPT